ncbi:disease resistance protein RPS5-like [Mangifera indica]|uniref:disease resistance protein RPS5-like n=1 Tax=Mangifera indica TaxID=29780 RepID=UPI001CF93459|nr:disease resistance protein RPS5-like [Mangifera indica]
MEVVIGPITQILKFVGQLLWRYVLYYRQLNENMEILKRRLADLNSQKEDVEIRLRRQCHVGKLLRAEVNNWLENTQRINNEAENIERQVKKGKCLSRICFGMVVAKKIEIVKEHYWNGAFESFVIDAPLAARDVLPTTTLVSEATAKKTMNEVWEFLMGHEVMKIRVCRVGGVAGNLLKILKGRKIVLILDDMWEAFQLEEVGIPKPTKDNGCKLVITTHSQDVCHSMGCKIVQVRTFSEDEALRLFIDKVGFNISEVPTLKGFVKPVAEQFSGLPLAIVAIVGCMRGEYNICEWSNAFKKLSKSILSVKGMETNVPRQLQFNYDHLNSKKVQRCFLYCALYREDFHIPKEGLIVYWIAEGLVDERGSLQATNDAGYSILNRLINNCLLETADHERCVKMHDLTRDMALQITSNNPLFMIKAEEGLSELLGEQEWKENLEKVSLMGNYISKIPSNLSPNCRALSTLLLQRNPLEGIPELFFVNMLSLKILDLSYTQIANLPNSISNLKNLTALLLNHCEQLSEVPSLKKLSALENLDLGFTYIIEMPKGIGSLTKLRSLDLNLPAPVVLPTAMLHTHKHLQKLRIYYGSINSEPVLTSEEAIRFSDQAPKRYRLQVASCSEEVPVSEFFSLPEYGDYFPNVEGVNKFVTLYTVGEGEDLVVLPTNVQCLMVRVCPEISDIKDLMLGNYPDLKFLYLMDCWNLKKLVSPKLLPNLQNLEVIEV